MRDVRRAALVVTTMMMEARVFSRSVRSTTILTTGLLFAVFDASIASATTCTTVAACVFGKNTGTSAGSGFAPNAGVSGASSIGDGIDGETTYNSTSSRAKSGVSGYDNSTKGTRNSGVFGYSKLGSGVHATTSAGNGLFAYASGAGIPIQVQGQTSAIRANFQGDGTGLTITDGFPNSDGGNGIFVDVADDGMDIGTTFGYDLALGAGAEGGGESIESYANDGLDINTGPNSANDNNSLFIAHYDYMTPILVENTMSLDSDGNMVLKGGLKQHGTVSSMTGTRANGTVTAYVPREADATIEDVGEATVRAGRATVALEPSFASTIDPRQAYYVFLTAEGENRGLYVSAKSPRGFAIRETNGGASTLDVQYRIVAKPYDAIGTPRFAAVDQTNLPYANAKTRKHALAVTGRQAHSRMLLTRGIALKARLAQTR